MTLYKPTIIVKRMVIKREKEIAYDEQFHTGVNVIRGDNSSGKSTTMNFLFYGLGGDLNDWSDVAILCSHVWLEVELNGNPVTLRRAITNKALSGMEIYGGRYNDAVLAPIEAWKKYSYSRTANLESFSQALFRLMEMPDVASELSGNVTIHQILRLLYADQLSPIEKIFRDESFDHSDLRETVGNLLCGAFDTDIYESQQLLKIKEKSFDSAAAELRSIISILGGEESMGVDWVTAQRKTLLSERENIFKKVEVAEAENYSSSNQNKITLSGQAQAYSKVQKLQQEMSNIRDKIRECDLDISDSSDFIHQISNKIDTLRDAESIASIITGINFSACPACFAKVEDLAENMSACSLCKAPFDSERSKERIAGLVNEAAIQLKQSNVLQEIRKNRLEEFKLKEVRLIERWKDAARELQILQILPTTSARQAMRELSRQLGYIDRQIDDLENKLKLAQKVEELSLRKQQLAGEIDGLKNSINLMKATQTSRLSSAKHLIETETIKLLRNDLQRQDSFENPDSITFSFKKNKIGVDEHSYFSASSRVILRCSFMLGFLSASLINKSFRHPRFIMIDVTENNGMEIERSHNLQHQIMAISKQAKVQHQIIYATAFPSPEIDDDNLIGGHATRDKRTLQIMS